MNRTTPRRTAAAHFPADGARGGGYATKGRTPAQAAASPGER
jgi:hypothetical protein